MKTNQWEYRDLETHLEVGNRSVVTVHYGTGPRTFVVNVPLSESGEFEPAFGQGVIAEFAPTPEGRRCAGVVAQHMYFYDQVARESREGPNIARIFANPELSGFSEGKETYKVISPFTGEALKFLCNECFDTRTLGICKNCKTQLQFCDCEDFTYDNIDCPKCTKQN